MTCVYNGFPVEGPELADVDSSRKKSKKKNSKNSKRSRDGSELKVNDAASSASSTTTTTSSQLALAPEDASLKAPLSTKASITSPLRSGRSNLRASTRATRCHKITSHLSTAIESGSMPSWGSTSRTVECAMATRVTALRGTVSTTPPSVST